MSQCLKCGRPYPGVVFKWCDKCKRNRSFDARKVRSRFISAQSQAKSRGHYWILTLEQYEAVISEPCVYCGLPLNPTGSGLDRLDNSKGYELGNVGPCCKKCNRIKGDNLTCLEMTVAMQAVLRLRGCNPHKVDLGYKLMAAPMFYDTIDDAFRVRDLI